MIKIPKGWKRLPLNATLKVTDMVWNYPGWVDVTITSVFPLKEFTYIRRIKKRRTGK